MPAVEASMAQKFRGSGTFDAPVRARRIFNAPVRARRIDFETWET